MPSIKERLLAFISDRVLVEIDSASKGQLEKGQPLPEIVWIKVFRSSNQDNYKVQVRQKDGELKGKLIKALKSYDLSVVNYNKGTLESWRLDRIASGPWIINIPTGEDLIYLCGQAKENPCGD